MSALLAIDAQKINICAEYGYGNRNFSQRPRYLAASSYDSALFLIYRQSKALPHRHASYRNHFTMFRGKRDVIVVRSETTLVFRDNDVVLLYDRIRPSDEQTNRFRTSYENWDVSFDRGIEYTDQRPKSFVDYELVCSGEWWFYDRGIILNGVTRYIPECESSSILIYYELHTPMRFNATSLLAKSTDAAAAMTTNTNKTPSSAINNFDYQLPRLTPNRVLPFVNATVRPTVRANDNARLNDPTYEAVMPSLYWFVTRARELENNNISYFLPINYARPTMMH